MLKNGHSVILNKRRISDVLFAGIAVAVPVFLLLFVFFPLVKMLTYSFFQNGQWNFSHYQQLLGGRYITLFRNTLLVTFSSTFLAVMLGLSVTLAIHRSRIRFRKLFHYAAILNMISPPFVSAIVFIMLFGRRGLIANRLLGMSITLVGPQMIVVLQTIANASIAYLVISSVLRGIDPNIEKSATDLGASRYRVFYTVTLPLLAPGLIASASLIFANVLADFGTPILVGGGYRVLASEAYIQLLSNYNLGYAATLSVALLFLSSWMFTVERLLLKNKEFVSANIAEQTSELVDHTNENPYSLLNGLLATLFSLLIVTQFFTVAAGAFTNVWGYDFSFSLRHFQTARFQISKSLQNSLYFAFRVALIGPMLGITAAYLYQRSRGLVRTAINHMAMAPFAVPGTVMGISYVMAFNRPPLALTGTAMIIIIVCMIRELPISFNSAKAILKQVSNNLEEASRDLGASRWHTFTRIIVPILFPAYKAGMLHGFIHVMITIGAIIFLITPRYVTITFEIFRAVNSGRLGEGAAYAFTLVVFTVLGLAGLHLLWKMPALFCRIKEKMAVK
ncbi:ABC transporter permease [Anoxynatronum buryatiense]|uniref:Iron(III) transport system permease protein n=1 Tax=Anoxynatronum buryatiense TaxID=489973 RepID=A0AA46AHM1_9CLOT|nr:iron ABC transporter permease [Anoxynatronum buryatiense]SMP40218.1 iron(III) transport system permease protein [Anoxynatronum buryatiense]